MKVVLRRDGLIMVDGEPVGVWSKGSVDAGGDRPVRLVCNAKVGLVSFRWFHLSGHIEITQCRRLARSGSH